MNHTGFEAAPVRFWGGMFFVPVFFLLSGYTYHVREDGLKERMIKKAKRLLVPYFVANAVLFAFFFCKDVLLLHTKTLSQMMQSLVGIFYARNQLFSVSHLTLFGTSAEEVHPLMNILNSPTWFLPALFLTILFFEAAAFFCHRDIRKMWLVGAVSVLLGVLYHYACGLLLPWSLDAAAFFYVLFLLGYCMKKYQLLTWLDQNLWVLCLLTLSFIFSAKLNGSANFSIAVYGRSITLALLNAAISSILVMYLCQKCDRFLPKIFAWAGRQTLFTLCYHMLLVSVLEVIWPGAADVFIILFTVIVLSIASGMISFVKNRLCLSQSDAKEKEAMQKGKEREGKDAK